MPLYEYRCPDCEKQIELLIRGSEVPRCPDCSSSRLERLLSAPSAHVGSRDLPRSRSPMPGGCGRPQCGMGGCMLEE